jgi:cytidyltransferase-like protein
LEFYRRSSHNAKSIGILAGSFNPPTVAHLELARAAKARVDEILCVVPRAFPHKEYFGATLEQRMEMLDSVGLPGPYSIANTEQGLFIDIARACGLHYDSGTKLYFVCGRDAAERILNWDYGEPGVVQKMMREFELLVAARGGRLQPPSEFQDRMHELVIQGEHDEVSSSEVRVRIARGEPWEHLVPESIIERVREIYS